ncbi:type II toxin-antitoxin system HicA family toxin [Desulfocicer vacuolatum]|uniref:type II toxin-antitoxin system HicA family toxin n=1 Tax=Desulfocicer vacuolatum TaxID=2298 RepID=UPI0014836646|nr:type II toxin-antitoxin system HicA family toxin [Desulfocicer vacuolatum]
MKKNELIKKIKKKGAFFIGEGANHEIWESKNGYRFTVPRHSNVKEILAKTILKQADK